MSARRDAGEPLGRGQLARRRPPVHASRGGLFGAALLTVIVLVSGVLAILFLALMEALGFSTSTSAVGLSLERGAEVESSLHELIQGRDPRAA